MNQQQDPKRVERFTIDYPKTEAGRKDWNKRFSLNSIYAGKPWKERRGDANEWHMIVAVALQRSRVIRKMFDKPFEITIYWNDVLDVDNHAYMGKMIVDGLRGRLIPDDRKKFFKKVAHAYHSEDYILVEVAEI